MVTICYFIQQEHTYFFSKSRAVFTKIGHILSHKTHLHKWKSIKIIKCLLSDLSGLQLEINQRNISGKFQQAKIKQHISKLFISQRRNRRRYLKIFWTKCKNNFSKFVGCSKSKALEGGVSRLSMKDF